MRPISPECRQAWQAKGLISAQPSHSTPLSQAILQFLVLCPIDPVPYEPVFVFRQIGKRAADGLDLAIEFSTLGEYGFLPAGAPSRERTSAPRCAPAPRGPRAGKRRPCPRKLTGGCEGTDDHARPETQPQPQESRRSTGQIPRVKVIGALRTPRIELDSAA